MNASHALWTPCRPQREFFQLWVEVQAVNPATKMFRNIQLAFHEGSAHNQLRGPVWDTGLLPGLDLLPHGLEVLLHAVVDKNPRAAWPP
jgi:hypothetical protein